MKNDNEAFLLWIQRKHNSDSFCSELVETCKIEFAKHEGLDNDGRSAIYRTQREKIHTKHHARLKKHLRVRCNS